MSVDLGNSLTLSSISEGLDRTLSIPLSSSCGNRQDPQSYTGAMSACLIFSFTSTPQFPLWRSKLASSASTMNWSQKNVLSLSEIMRRCSSMALRMDARSVL